MNNGKNLDTLKKQETIFESKLLHPRVKWIFLGIALIIVPLLLTFLPFILNQINRIPGLENIQTLEAPIWWAFWGSYLGGVATLMAVWWTISQSEEHFRKQSAETFLIKEEDRRLSVKPLLIYQSMNIRTKRNPFSVANLDEEELMLIDEIEEEFIAEDVSEIVVKFAENVTIEKRGLSQQEKQLIINNGEVRTESSNGMAVVSKRYATSILQERLINAGAGAAIDGIVTVETAVPSFERIPYFIFSLLPNQEIKITFLLLIPTKLVKYLFDEYKIEISYKDIYDNKYRQTSKMVFKTENQEFKSMSFEFTTNQERVNIQK